MPTYIIQSGRRGKAKKNIPCYLISKLSQSDANGNFIVSSSIGIKKPEKESIRVCKSEVT